MLVPVLLMLAGHLYAMPVDVIPNLEYGGIYLMMQITYLPLHKCEINVEQ